MLQKPEKKVEKLHGSTVAVLSHGKQEREVNVIS